MIIKSFYNSTLKDLEQIFTQGIKVICSFFRKFRLLFRKRIWPFFLDSMLLCEYFVYGSHQSDQATSKREGLQAWFHLREAGNGW